MPRSRSAALVAALTSAVLLTGCGGSEQRAPLVPEVARPIAAPGGDGRVHPLDTSRPKDLLVISRFRDPEDTLDAMSTLSGTPLSMVLSILAQTGEGALLSAVDMRAPVDLALALPPGTAFAGGAEDESTPPFVGMTFGVRDVDRAAASLPKGWSARPSRAGLRILGEDGVICESETRGHVPARIFCASSEAASRLLGGWMTRTLVAEPLPPVDARITVLGAPVRAHVHTLIAEELRGEVADARDGLAQLGVTDPELAAIPGLLVDELEALVEDADQLELDFDLDAPGKGASARSTLRFRGTTGWVARVLADPAERRGPPPAIFWRAPKDSDSASWAMSSSPRHFAGIRRVWDKATRLAASRADLHPDEVAALAAAVDGIPSISGPWLVAQGSLPWKVPPKGNVTPQNAVADLKDRARSYVGWGIVGLEAQAGPWVDWLAKLDTAWKKGVGVMKRELKGSKDLDEIPDLKIVRGPNGYPRGTVALDVVAKLDSHMAWDLSPRMPNGFDVPRPEHPAGNPARGSATLRVVVVPDGPRTFVGWSLDDAALRSHVRAALRDAPDGGTIAARTDLARLKRDGTGGGYFTLSSWSDLAMQLGAEQDDPSIADAAKALAQLPHKAATPILTFADGTAGNTPTLTFDVVVQEGTVDDVRALTQFAMKKGLEGILGGTASPPAAVPAPVAPARP